MTKNTFLVLITCSLLTTSCGSIFKSDYKKKNKSKETQASFPVVKGLPDISFWDYSAEKRCEALTQFSNAYFAQHAPNLAFKVLDCGLYYHINASINIEGSEKKLSFLKSSLDQYDPIQIKGQNESKELQNLSLFPQALTYYVSWRQTANRIYNMPMADYLAKLEKATGETFQLASSSFTFNSFSKEDLSGTLQIDAIEDPSVWECPETGCPDSQLNFTIDAKYGVIKVIREVKQGQRKIVTALAPNLP